MSDFIDIESMLNGSKYVWHEPIDFHMADGASLATDIPLDRFDTHIFLHPVIEFDGSQPDPRVDYLPPKDTDQPLN